MEFDVGDLQGRVLGLFLKKTRRKTELRVRKINGALPSVWDIRGGSTSIAYYKSSSAFAVKSSLRDMSLPASYC